MSPDQENYFKTFEKVSVKNELSHSLKDLPVLNHQQEIKELFKNNESFLLVGETGSGKTTQLPIIISEELDEGEKILITQPRRVAARSVAKYVAQNKNCEIGEDVGYQIRFEDHASEGTVINFVTDGILLRKIQQDPLLTEYSVIILDEAHERSLNIDFALGLLKRVQKKRKEAKMPVLKLIVTSATLEKDKFSKYFGDSPMLEIPGRLHKVEMHYENHYINNYTEAAANKVQEIINNGLDGDILIFMTGQDDINRTIKEIELLNLENILVLPLHGQLSPDEQDKIFKNSSKRKIIVSTNVAETSLTVPGIKHVIDSGKIKQIEFDNITRIESLEVRDHAQSGCIQRAGRAGRITEGHCWCLYSKESFEQRKKFQVPEIKRTNLAHVVLIMKRMGIEDLKNFDFIDQPDSENFENSIEELKDLGALDEEENITEIGILMSELPLEPKISRMLIEANKYGCVEAVTTIVSFLGMRNVFNRPRGKEYEADEAHEKFEVSGSDFLSLLKVWQEYKNHINDKNYCRNNFLNERVLREVSSIRYQLFRILRRNKIFVSKNDNQELIGKSIVSGLISDLMIYDSYYRYRRLKDNQSDFYIHPSSVTFGNGPNFLVPGQIMQTKKVYARNIQTVKKEWIKELAPHLVKKGDSRFVYDPERDQVFERIEFYLKDDDTYLSEEEKEVDQELAQYYFIKYLINQNRLNFILENQKVFDEVNKLRIRSGKNEIPEITREEIINIYSKRMNNISSFRELNDALEKKSLDLEFRINDFISDQELKTILKDNPDNIVINNQEYHIDYINVDKAQILMNYEDIFDLKDFPKLDSGRVLNISVKFEDETKNYNVDSFEEFKKNIKDKILDDLWYDSSARNYEKEFEVNDLSDVDKAMNMQLPEIIVLGKDIETKKDILVYPGLSTAWYSNTFKICYFKSQKKAEESTNEVYEKIKKLKSKFEDQNLLKEAREKLEEIQNIFDKFVNLSRSLGIKFDDISEINDELYSISSDLRESTREKIEILNELEQKIVFNIKKIEQKKVLGDKIYNFLKTKFSICPVCKNELRDEYVCHNVEEHQNYINVAIDTNGNNIEESTSLMSIKTDQGEDVAELIYNDYYKTVSVVLEESKIVKGYWLGKEFDDLILEDKKMILTKEEAKSKALLISKIKDLSAKVFSYEEYQDNLDYAEKQVESGYWRKGKFKLAKHPKTGEEQMEISMRKSGILVKYIVDKYDTQPSESEEYFFSEKRTLVDAKNFKLIIVRIESPYPEDEIEFTNEEKAILEKIKSGNFDFKKLDDFEKDEKVSQSSVLSAEELNDSIEDLKNLWT